MVASTGYYTQSPRCMSTLRRMREIIFRGLLQSSNGCVIFRSWVNCPAYLLPHSCVQEAANPIYLLAWIPESLLDEKGQSEWDKFVSVEGKAPYDEEEGEPVPVRFWAMLIILSAVRWYPHRLADFTTRDIRILRTPHLRVFIACLPSESVFLV